MVCQTIIEPPVDGVITRDNIKCKISYTAEGKFTWSLYHIFTLAIDLAWTDLEQLLPSADEATSHDMKLIMYLSTLIGCHNVSMMSSYSYAISEGKKCG